MSKYRRQDRVARDMSLYDADGRRQAVAAPFPQIDSMTP